MFWKSKTKNSGMYNTLSISANLVNWTQSGTNWNGILTEATMLANNIDYTRVMNVVPQWTNGTNSNGWVTTISRSSADNNIYITLTRGSGGSGGSVDTTNLVTTNTNQTITGDKQFNANAQFNKIVEIHNMSNQDNSLVLYRENNKANFISFFNGTTRQGFMGKESANSNDITIKAETGDLVLTSLNANISANNKRIINLSTPNANGDAVNKAYVDNYYNWGNHGFLKNDLTTTNHANAWVHWTLPWANSIVANKVNKYIVKITQNNIEYSTELSINVSDVTHKNASEVKCFKIVNTDGSNDNNEKYIYFQLVWISATQVVLNLKTTDAISTNFSITIWKLNNLTSISS